jgi:hypothetical protein
MLFLSHPITLVAATHEEGQGTALRPLQMMIPQACAGNACTFFGLALMLFLSTFDAFWRSV